MHQNQVDVIHLQLPQGLLHALGNMLVIRVADLGRNEDGFPGNARVPDSLAHFCFVSISLSSVVVISIPHQSREDEELTYRCAGNQSPKRS
jgi:hypothetical protein